MQVPGDRGAVARERSGIAPTIAGAIVPAGPREPRDFTLHEYPSISGSARAALEHDGRSAFAGTIDVERPSSDIHRPADPREALAAPPLPVLFVCCANR